MYNAVKRYEIYFMNSFMLRVKRRQPVKMKGYLSKSLLSGWAFFPFLAINVTFSSAQPLPGGTLDPATIPKYVEQLTIPPVMPLTGMLKTVAYYEIAVRQFEQQILPRGMPKTKVWGYGSVIEPATFSYPGWTIEAKVNRPVRIKWINDLKDKDGNFLPHLLPVDQTLHWANPPQDCIDGIPRPDCNGRSQELYAGPVPIVTHLHGAHVNPESDGFPEAWYLPAADNIPPGYARRGSRFGQIAGAPVEDGAAVFQYRNDQRAATLWYHDHTIGMTRSNVYTGLAGFYLLRGGPADLRGNVLPGPAPAISDPPGKKYYEIPVVIQDRSFNTDGSLFYSSNRAFFEGLSSEQLRVPFIPEPVFYSNIFFPLSDVSPIWNPEFFGNAMVVNGKTWPYIKVEQRRYRFRLLNGSDSRFLILTFPGNSSLSFWQIGNDGGFLPRPVELTQLLIAPAERADVLVDFADIPVGTVVNLLNVGPDGPFSGGVPGVDFEPSDSGTTGQVMQFRVVPSFGEDKSEPPQSLVLPKVEALGAVTNVRKVTLNEFDSSVVLVRDGDGKIVLAPKFEPDDPNNRFFGPVFSMLGELDSAGLSIARKFEEPITENPALNSIEIWEIYNFTADAHPIHLHQVAFEVIERQDLETDEEGIAVQPAQLVPGTVTPPDPWETGFKDTVVVYPGKVTRIKANFDIPGLYVWHCHILSHEDNEMMRPLCVGDLANCM